MNYTETQRSEALALYERDGAAGAARLLDFTVSPATIRVWAHRAGKSRYGPEKTAEATAAHQRRQTELREEMRELALASAVDMLLRLHEPQFVGTDDEGTPIFATPNAKDCQAYSIAYGILNDKYRLEMGEATSRSELTDASKIDLELARTVEEWRNQTHADRD